MDTAAAATNNVIIYAATATYDAAIKPFIH
jgi:hypothetical protein